ncbi:MAG: Protein-methionine-sulfoxide reductase heme-binding subunit MsrQ [Arcobacter lacus]|nr:MAG: Protein-methionine-sulfoxide reductase heme-binding subunit MsrQ [Arcobacter lacus]
MKKILLIIALFLPALYLTYEILIVQNINDPIKYIYTFTGVSAIVLILASVLISVIKKFLNFMKYRKLIGLFGFFYASLHFLNFVILDAELSIPFIISETIKKPFIYLGMFSFLIIILMAVTSTKKLYKRYSGLHKLIYLSILSFFIHTIIAQKSIVLIDAIFIAIVLFIGLLKILQYRIFIK